MRLILDSSAALRASMSPAAAAGLTRHELGGPPLLWSEVYSAVREARWRDELDDAEVTDLLARFTELHVTRRSPRRLHDEAYRFANELGWAKTYDAEFLALAHLEGAKLLTTDGRLRRGAARTGLVITPAEL